MDTGQGKEPERNKVAVGEGAWGGGGEGETGRRGMGGPAD